jgi:hypothetical protein
VPHHILAAVLIQLDQPHPGKQELLCIQYALSSGLHVIGKCHEGYEALAMVTAGTVAAIITVVNPGGSLADDLARWSGQLHVVRPVVPTRRRPDVERLAGRMYQSGLDTQAISIILEVPPEQVRKHRNPRRPE